mmetsp:Transcript_74453/g.164450  ORF Transcript_74453/g.164450 Transcript_74453/m.164450 type:complete len:100 (-) Transcript_74453:146-445(-)
MHLWVKQGRYGLLWLLIFRGSLCHSASSFFVNAQIDLQTAAASSMSACLRTARNETAHPTLLRQVPQHTTIVIAYIRKTTKDAWAPQGPAAIDRNIPPQ